MENKQPLVSVIMPVYNGAEWLKECIDSVLAQTFTDFEFVAVNDESKDNSLEILQEYAKNDKRVVLFNNKNIGAGPSLDFGVAHANGKYLCFIDQDDFYRKDFLEKMVASIEHFDSDFALCYGQAVNEHGALSPLGYPYYDETAVDVRDMQSKMPLYEKFIPQWTKIIKRDFILRHHIKFGGRTNRAHDFPFHLLALWYAEKISFVHENLYFHRRHSKQISALAMQDPTPGIMQSFDQLKEYAKTYEPKNKDFMIFAIRLLSCIKLKGKNKIYAGLLKWRYMFFSQLKHLFYHTKISGNKKYTYILCFKLKKKIKNTRGGVLSLTKIPADNVGKYAYCVKPIFIANAKETSFGSFVSIGENCRFGHGDHPLNYLSTSPYFYYNELGFKDKKAPSHQEFWNYAPIEVGNDVWIGDNVFVKNGIKIGNGAVVGAGSVVTKDVPPYAIVAGVPAKVLRYRFDEATIAKLESSRWWYKSDDEIRQLPYDNIPAALGFLDGEEDENGKN